MKSFFRVVVFHFLFLTLSLSILNLGIKRLVSSGPNNETSPLLHQIQ
ncbi:unnamed protein product [Brassica rapa subsp. narinosa]